MLPESKAGQNFWHVEQADFASVIVDCAPYYRALHEAICRAKKSVFVLGWDIDSRIELLRGHDAKKSEAPHRFFDLVKWKAEQNPEIQFYLNRWDYTLYQASEREGLSLLRWRLFVPKNVHYHLDNMHPVGGCHHQKIVVIDDELAFVGGMDIAIGRWDYRSHHPRNKHRMDPGGTYEPRTRHLYPPHHDVMMMVAGPAAKRLGELVRERWRSATGQDPETPSVTHPSGIKPKSWPPFIEPQFIESPVTISRTMPPMKGKFGIQEIEQLYLDQIAQAERFIYIENQYLTSIKIAEALNRQLKSKPGLRAALVSCREPQGIMERKAMWGGRVLFRDAVTAGGVNDRVLMAYPFSHEHGDTEAIRIHSKVLVIDDKILRVGSSNINNRSMRMDTECDLSIEAKTLKIRNQIGDIRNDMIREHTGLPLDRIRNIIEGRGSPAELAVTLPGSRQHLCPIDDEQYRHQFLMKLAIRIADPPAPFFPQNGTPGIASQNWLSRVLMILPFLTLFISIALLWRMTPLARYAHPSHIVPVLLEVKQSVWAFPAVIGIYVVATMVFFPLTILVFATSISFPPLQALALAFGGMFISACCGYGVGRIAGFRFLRFFAGPAAEKISSYTKNGGVLGVTLLRMVPIAPLGVVDFSLGMARVPFGTYLAGTVLGLAPGILAFTLLGHSVEHLWHDLTYQNALLVGCGVAAWLGVVVFSHMAVKRWRRKRNVNCVP